MIRLVASSARSDYGSVMERKGVEGESTLRGVSRAKVSSLRALVEELLRCRWKVIAQSSLATADAFHVPR